MRIIILAFAMLVTACTSQIASKQDRLQKHIGSNITDIQALYLTERSRPISFGNLETMLGLRLKSL